MAKTFKTSAAACAAAIRAELKTAFPGIKFSVTSDTYSMGNTVDIRWEDGPITKEVDSIVSKYQYGHFDSMQDMYENTNRRTDIPQAKYIMTHREISKAVEAILLPQAEVIFSQYDHCCNSANNLLYRIFVQSPIPIGALVTGLQETGATCGQINDFYTIAFEQVSAQPRPAKIEGEAGIIQIIDYSEKAIAVIGDTRTIKDKLKELGGKFNFRLSCGAGWIFPKTKLETLQAALS